MFRSVEHLFRPQSVAIVGASESGGAGWPRAIYENAEHAGFPIPIYLINPRRETLWSRPVFPSFASLPEPVDLALTIIPAESVVDSLAEGLAHGLKAGLVYASRFGEGGDEPGAARVSALRALCDDGLRICGPNCMGSISLPGNLLFYPASRVRSLPRGGVGVIFQSGGTFQYWLQQGAVRGLGFSYAVSSGNELDLDSADYLSFMIDDPETKVIACMLEGIRRPEAFMAAAAKALDAGKPIVAVKAGASEAGRRATESHTGAIAGDDDIFNAVCDRYGIVRCLGLDDMIEAALIFLKCRLPAGERVSMAGFSGGAKGLFLDYAAATGLAMAEFTEHTNAALQPLLDPGLKPTNPLDTGAGLARRPEKFAEICRIIAADPNVDVLSMQGQLPASEHDDTNPETYSSVAAEGTPVIAHIRMGQNVDNAGRTFQESAGIPFILGLPETVRALKALTGYAARRRQGLPAATPFREWTGDLEAALSAAGLPTPKNALAADLAEAACLAAEIGFPVALKVVSAAASHKTEIDGVALNLADGEAVKRAGHNIAARLEAAVPGGQLDGFLVQEMVSGLELLVGASEDPQFGPFIVVGLGGVAVEVLGDVAFRLLPIDRKEAHAMLSSLRSAALLEAFRGRPARDVDALVSAMVGLSEVFLAADGQFADLEINPLIVLARGEGVRAVDIRPVERTGKDILKEAIHGRLNRGPWRRRIKF